MKIINTLLAASLLTITTSVVANEGMISVKSPHNVNQTITRLEDIAKQRGLIIFARIDHAAGAAKINKTLRPTELLIFGNPQGGTPLMECAQTMGLDLPLKALAWEDEKGVVWLGYNDPTYIAKRHAAPACAAVANVSKALAGLVDVATKP